jgi:hypothetical protein
MHFFVFRRSTLLSFWGGKTVGNSGVGGACGRVEVRPGSLDMGLWPGGDIAMYIQHISSVAPSRCMACLTYSALTRC